MNSSYPLVFSVTSGKGGVGKTNISVNLALTLAARGKRVLLLDADLGLANVDVLLGLHPEKNIFHLFHEGASLRDILLPTEYGFSILPASSGVSEMLALNPGQKLELLDAMDELEDDLDFLIVDTGAGISENVLRFAGFADEVIAVTTPNIAANADCFSIIRILLEMDPKSRIGLVTNMARDMYEAKNVFNKLQTASRQVLGYELNDLGFVVESEHMKVATEQRKPVVFAYPNAPVSRCFRQIVD